MSLRDGRCVVDDHSAVVEQPLHDIHGVFGSMEVFFELFHTTVRPRQDDIVPGVHVDLIEFGVPEERCQDRIFDHFAVQAVDQLFVRKSFHEESLIEDVFLDIRLELIVLVFIGQRSRVVFGDEVLSVGKDIPEVTVLHTRPPFRRSPSYGNRSACLWSAHTAFLSAFVP